MKRKKISAKVWASIMAAAMVMSTCPTAAFAVTADKVATDWNLYSYQACLQNHRGYRR